MLIMEIFRWIIFSIEFPLHTQIKSIQSNLLLESRRKISDHAMFYKIHSYNIDPNKLLLMSNKIGRRHPYIKLERNVMVSTLALLSTEPLIFHLVKL